MAKKGWFGAGKALEMASEVANETSKLVQDVGGNTEEGVRRIFIVDNRAGVVENDLKKLWRRFTMRCRRRLNKNVSENDLKVEQVEVIDEKEKNPKSIYKITVPIVCLMYEACLRGIKCQLKSQKILEWIEKLDDEDRKDKKSSAEDRLHQPAERDNCYPSSHFIYVPCEMKHFEKDSFVKDPVTEHYLSEIQQIWLLENIFDFTRMQGNDQIDSFFVRHNGKKDRDITFTNACWFESGDYTYKNFTKDPQPTPLQKKQGKVRALEMIGPVDSFDKIRNYYGEQVGLYFRFVTHIGKWCIPLALLGLACQAYIIATLQVESPVVAVYAAVVIIWSNTVTEVWKRVEQDCAFRWGMEGFESHEENRYQFDKKNSDAVEGFDPVTGLLGKEVNTTKYALKSTFSYIIIIFIMGLVVYTTITIYAIKGYLQLEFQDMGIPSQFSATCASVLNTVQIMLFKYLYQFVVSALNDFENHRTQTEYEDSMITKLTLFSFFNSYISFFYIAFVAGYIPVVANDDSQGTTQCGLTGCMAMLSENLLIVLLTSLTADKFTEFVLPLLSMDRIMRVLKCECCTKPPAESRIDQLKNIYSRPVYNFQGRLTDYTTLFVLFGYLVMFSPALPIASLFVAVSLAFESRGDLMKLFRQYRRVIPQMAEDIGAWQGAFEIITWVGVVSNSGLIVFTMGMFNYYSFEWQMWIFIFMQWTMFSLISLGSHLINDTPLKIQVQRDRRDYFGAHLKEFFQK